MSEYRRLQKNEFTQDGDEYDNCCNPWHDDPVWVPTKAGQCVPDPKHPFHRQYRRLWEPHDHEWEVIDESFDHEYGTEKIVFERCSVCDAERMYEPQRFDDDVI